MVLKGYQKPPFRILAGGSPREIESCPHEAAIGVCGYRIAFRVSYARRGRQNAPAGPRRRSYGRRVTRTCADGRKTRLNVRNRTLSRAWRKILYLGTPRTWCSDAVNNSAHLHVRAPRAQKARIARGPRTRDANLGRASRAQRPAGRQAAPATPGTRPVL